MSTIDGNDGVAKFGNDVMAKVTEFSVAESGNAQRTDGMGETHENPAIGKQKWTAKVSARFDDADAAQLACVVGAELAVTFIARGDVSGNVTRSGTAVIESVDWAANQDDRQTKSISLLGQGPLSVGVVA